MSNEMSAADWFKMAHESASDQIKHWRRALLFTNFLWCTVVVCLLWFAYFNPEHAEIKQDQDIQGQKQGQYYKGGGK